MRIRVSHRAVALGFLLALLCLTLVGAPTASAKPIDWNNLSDGPPPDSPKGDNDGGVLAPGLSRPGALGTLESHGTITGVGSRSSWTAVRTVYSYAGLRGFLALLRLDGWMIQLR